MDAVDKEQILDKFLQDWKGKKLIELASEMNALRVKLDELKGIKTILEAKHDIMRLNLVPSAMEEDDITTISIHGIGRINLQADVYTSILASNRDEAYKWLRDNNHGDLIKETINSGTLKSFVKGVIKKGKEKLPATIKVTPYSRAVITKK